MFKYNQRKLIYQIHFSPFNLLQKRLFSSLNSSQNTIYIRNPLTNEIVFQKQEHTLDQILNDVKEGKNSQELWKRVPLSEKQKLCNSFVEELQSKSEEISQHINQYTGKPLKESQLEMKATIHRMKQLIDMSEDALKTETIEDTIRKGKKYLKFITKHPIGTVFIISPWNYPILTASSVLMTSLLAGNNVLLKPSPQTVGIADDIVSCFARAASIGSQSNKGLKQLVKNVYTSNLDNFSHLYKHSDYVSFTGSIQTGLRVQKESIEANPWINCVLELGGKDAVYIHKSCSKFLDDVVKQIILGAFSNSGQSCCSVERVYCDSELLPSLIDKLQKLIENVKILDNQNENNIIEKEKSQIQVSPLTLKNHAQFIKSQVDNAVQEGAHILNKRGGTLIEFPQTEYNKDDEQARIRGFFPTIILNANNQMKLMQEETFGPVLPIISVKGDHKEAIKLMNDSKYGLTTSIFSYDEQVINEMSDQLNVGTVLVNQCLMMDPSLPWIGWNQSGKNFSLSKHGFDQVTKMKSHNHIYNI